MDNNKDNNNENNNDHNNDNNDNDFTFCKVEPPDQGFAVPDIGVMSIRDDSPNDAATNQIDNLLWKDNVLDKTTSIKEGAVGSLSYTVIDTASSKKKVSASGLQGQAATTKAPKVRAKVPFEIGHSQVDWLRLTRTHPDLAGLEGKSNRRLITIAEVKQHQKEGSIWTVLKGRVYNITHYMKFHPGGVDMLMKGAGKDCTSLFNKYHPWVNAEFMLEKCLVGTLDDSR